MRHSLIVIVGALVAGCVGGIIAIALSGTPAVASKLLPADLGPADALLLMSADGQLSLTNKGGRLAWSDAPSARAFSVGCVFIDRVMKGLLASDRFASERQRFDDEARAQGESFEQRSKSLQSKYPDLKPDDPQFEQAKQEFAQLQMEYEKWFAALQKIQSKHMGEQVQTAYVELLAALEVVAEKKKIDFVYRYVPPDRPFDSMSLADAMLQVQSRPFLRSPASVDITEEVIVELGLPSDP
ncbi:MAG: OmpH family outer membrane protein [Phycisphaerales bacterium]|nr:OmpH family outer membrane protein [Phycisphaerales bacterium]